MLRSVKLKTPELIEKSTWLRNELFELVMGCKRGHIPSSYSCSELILALFYGGYMRFDSANSKDPNRDRIIVSKGHAAMALYPVLADLGFYPASEMANFTKPNGLLRMYADHSIPGIESVTGSLGHGLGIGCGFALAAKKDGRPSNTFVILGDGELYEGSIWETLMFAAHHKLDNFIVLVDRNRLCIMDETENCVHLNPVEEKMAAFGCNVISIDGHRYSQILPSLEKATKAKNGKPTVIVANTVKGKGISFMENKHSWHNKMPNEQELTQARQELAQFRILE